MQMEKIILLAEDSEDDALFFSRVLKRAGVQNQIISFRDGRDAVAYLDGLGTYADRKKFPLPDIIFLDLKMAPLDGWDVLAWIRATPQLRDIPVIVLTHNAEILKSESIRMLGAKSSLVKPFTEADLLNLIARFPDPWILPPVGTDGPRL